MKRPLGVLVIAFTSWLLSALLLLTIVAIIRNPVEGISSSLCFLMAALSAAVGIGLFRLHYWA